MLGLGLTAIVHEFKLYECLRLVLLSAAQRLGVDIDKNRQRLEAFEMLIWRRMKKISWMNKINYEKVLAQ